MNIFKSALVAVAALAAFASAQEMHFGAHIGLGYTSFWNADITIPNSSSEGTYRKYEMSYSGLDEASGLGFSFGGSMLYKMGPSFALQPELLISYRSRTTDLIAKETEYYRETTSSAWRVEDTDVDALRDASITQWYLDIPVMARFNLAPSIFMVAGPVISLEVSADGEASLVSIDISDYTTTFVFGLQAGVGYSIAMGGTQLDIDLRFNMGLTNIVSDEIVYRKYTIDGTSIANPKDFNIYIGATYWFM